MNGRGYKDYYQTLGVSKDATQKEIKAAYRKLARRHHPDANPGNKAAEEKFKEVSEAYEVVGNAKKRKEYDEIGRFFQAGGPGGPGGPGGYRVHTGGPGGDFGQAFSDFGPGMGDLFDVFGGFGGAGGGAAPHQPQRGRDLYYSINLLFADAIKGVTTRLSVTPQAVCTDCGGSGAKPGTSPVICQTCQGRGSVAQNQGFFSLSRPCPQCYGQGTIIEQPCAKCGGRGRAPEHKKITVKIPPGVRDGSKIKLKGRGEPGEHGGPAGDLYVVTKVAAHPFFRQEGSDIVLDVPVTFAELALGAKITVPTIDGKVSLKVPAGTQDGRVFRVRGKGAPKLRGVGRGDMLARLKLQVPSKLSAKEKELIGKLGEAAGGDPREKLMQGAGL